MHKCEHFLANRGNSVRRRAQHFADACNIM